MAIKDWKRGSYRVEDQALEYATWRTHGRFSSRGPSAAVGSHAPAPASRLGGASRQQGQKLRQRPGLGACSWRVSLRTDRWIRPKRPNGPLSPHSSMVCLKPVTFRQHLRSIILIGLHRITTYHMDSMGTPPNRSRSSRRDRTWRNASGRSRRTTRKITWLTMLLKE